MTEIFNRYWFRDWMGRSVVVMFTWIIALIIYQAISVVAG